MALFDLRSGDCSACGKPVRRHFTAQNRKLSCEALAKIDGFRVGDRVFFWHVVDKRPRMLAGIVQGFSGDRAYVRVRDLMIRADPEYGGAAVVVAPSSRVIDASRLL